MLDDLANRIALPTATDTGERAGIIPQISTDAFKAYPEAIDATVDRIWAWTTNQM